MGIQSSEQALGKYIGLQQSQKEKLKEYKSVLIDSGVTGKINFY